MATGKKGFRAHYGHGQPVPLLGEGGGVPRAGAIVVDFHNPAGTVGKEGFSPDRTRRQVGAAGARQFGGAPRIGAGVVDVYAATVGAILADLPPGEECLGADAGGDQAYSLQREGGGAPRAGAIVVNLDDGAGAVGEEDLTADPRGRQVVAALGKGGGRPGAGRRIVDVYDLRQAGAAIVEAAPGEEDFGPHGGRDDPGT